METVVALRYHGVSADAELSFETITDRRLEEAASTLGTNAWWVGSCFGHCRWHFPEFSLVPVDTH